MLAKTGVIFVNKEEAEILVGDSTTVSDLLYRLHRLGPDIVVITDGPNGAFASDGINQFFLPIFPLKVVERTGAGDAFATGFVAALYHGNTIKEALRWGAANSASVVTKIGPEDGLLKLTELRKMLQRFIKIKPTIHRNHDAKKK